MVVVCVQFPQCWKRWIHTENAEPWRQKLRPRCLKVSRIFSNKRIFTHWWTATMPSPTPFYRQTTASGSYLSDTAGLSQYEGWQQRAIYLGGYTCTRPGSTNMQTKISTSCHSSFFMGFALHAFQHSTLGRGLGTIIPWKGWRIWRLYIAGGNNGWSLRPKYLFFLFVFFLRAWGGIHQVSEHSSLMAEEAD